MSSTYREKMLGRERAAAVRTVAYAMLKDGMATAAQIAAKAVEKYPHLDPIQPQVVSCAFRGNDEVKSLRRSVGGPQRPWYFLVGSPDEARLRAMKQGQGKPKEQGTPPACFASNTYERSVSLADARARQLQRMGIRRISAH